MSEQVINLNTGRDPIYREKAAAAAMTPGDIIAVESDGDVALADTAVHATNPAYLIADKDISNGGTIDTAYASGDRVRYGCYSEGDEVLLRLADGENVAEGESLGLGTGATAGQVIAGAGVAVALEAVNNSAGGSPARIKARLARVSAATP